MTLRKILALAVTCSVLATNTCLVQAKELTLPKDQPVTITFPNAIMGSQLKKGDAVKVLVNEDVVIEDETIFKKGQEGQAIVLLAKPPKSFGQEGIIEFQSLQLKDEFGNSHTLRLKETIRGVRNYAGSMLPAMAAASIILLPLVGFAAAKGKEAILPIGAIMSGYTTEAVTLHTDSPENPTVSTTPEAKDELRALIESLEENTGVRP